MLWEPPQAHPGLCKAVGSTWMCFLALAKCFGAWGLPLLLHLLTPKPFANTNKAPKCYSIKWRNPVKMFSACLWIND